jgi:hypothetical protein
MEGELLFIDTDIQAKLDELRVALRRVDDEEQGPVRESGLDECTELVKSCKSLMKSFKLEAASAGLPSSKTAPHNQKLKKYQGQTRNFESDLGRAKMGE